MNSVRKYKTSRKAWGSPGLLVLGLLAFVVLPVTEAYAQSAMDNNRRLNRIENEIQTLSRAIFRGEAPPAGSLSSQDTAQQANTEIRLQQMEQDLQSLRGLIEEQGFTVRKIGDDFERMKGDVELRLNDLERGASASGGGQKQGSAMGYTTRGSRANGGGGAAAPRPNVSPAADGFVWGSNNGTAQAQNSLGQYSQSSSGDVAAANVDAAAATYENAFSLLKNNKYDAAEKEFKAFLAGHGEHPLAGNAKYWLGETYYVRGQFDDAARLFAAGYQQFPEGSKAADNLLKLGMSLSALGKNDDACIALDQISKEKFAGAGPVMRRADQEKSRLGCG